MDYVNIISYSTHIVCTVTYYSYNEYSCAAKLIVWCGSKLKARAIRNVLICRLMLRALGNGVSDGNSNKCQKQENILL